MRTVILALGLFTCGDNGEMTTAHHSDLQLTGETVTVSYVSDPSVSRGQFRLENPGTVAVMAAVKSAWLESGGNQQPLAGISVFNLDQEQAMDPDGFNVDAKTTVSFLIGFPKVAHEPRFGESTAVGLQLSINGIEVQALSPIKFVRRIPYGR